MFAEDTSVYFNADTGFAQPCILAGVEVSAIFDNSYALGSVGPFGMASTQATITLPTSSVPDGVVGQTCVVADTSYAVAAHEPDGTGISLLRLEVSA